MKNGKLNSDDLKHLLKTYTGYPREELILSGRLGEDCSFVKISDQVLVISTDPVTAATKGIGKIAFSINLNDISTSGAPPLGIMVTLLLPEGSNYEDVKGVMEEIHNECYKHKISILGGHTEVTDAVKRAIVSITIFGVSSPDRIITSKGMELNDTLVVSKDLCIEGSYIIYNEFRDKFDLVLNKEEEKIIENFGNLLSVSEEGKAGSLAHVSMMHDITEGGILGAVHEVCEGNKLGCIIYENKLPIHEVSRKICTMSGVDPLRLISSGSMLFSTKNPDLLISMLNSRGIKSSIIGKVTKKDIILVDKNGNERKIEPPKRDEIYRLFV